MEWVTKNNAKAIELYEKAKVIGGTEKVSDTLVQDSDILLKRGISEKELLLLRDLII